MSIFLTVDDVERDGVGLGVRGGAGELAGVAQVRPRDPQRAHQPATRATTVLRHLRQGGRRFNGNAFELRLDKLYMYPIQVLCLFV